MITALIAWHAPGPKWFVPWAQDCSNRALHHFSPDGWLGTKSVQRPSDKPKEFLRVIEEWRVPLTKCFERTTSILYWRTLLRLVRRLSCNYPLPVMVFVNLQLKIKEGSQDSFIQELNKLLPETRSFEGCHAVYFGQNQDDPTTLEFFSKWDSKF